MAEKEEEMTSRREVAFDPQLEDRLRGGQQRLVSCTDMLVRRGNFGQRQPRAECTRTVENV